MSNKISVVGSHANDDARSHRSVRSMSSKISTNLPPYKKLPPNFEDQTQRLNLSEEEWNKIVVKNLENFKTEKVRVVNDKL